MSSTRRDALVFLGLAGASSAAIATENLVEKDGIVTSNAWSNQKAAMALRKLAEGIEKAQVLVFDLNVSSSLTPGEILTQTLTLKFDIKE